MQNRYSGDIGDYSKFVLLRKLFNDASYRIGLIWYLYPNESHNDDGRHIEYIQKKEYQDCDEELILGLSKVVAGKRNIMALQSIIPLPRNTIFYSAPLDFHQSHDNQTLSHKQQRITLRLEWIDNACTAVKDCNVVVLDPDNGLQIKSCPNINQRKSGKFAYYNEVKQLFQNKSVCMIYQHLNRTQSHRSQIHQRAHELKNIIANDDSVFCIRFSPYSPRAYFILTTSHETEIIRGKIQTFMNGICGFGWDSYYEC